MKYFTLLVCSFFLLSCKDSGTNNNSKEETTKNTDASSKKLTTTYYFIRHAEKDRKAETNDPHLLPIGMDRAIFWAEWFKDKNLDYVYSTNYNRTIETARPTADQAKVSIKLYEANQLFTEDFKKETLGKNVLVVGHSDTTPRFINKIIGNKEYTDIPDHENGNIYTVTIFSDGKISSRVEHPDFKIESN